MEEKINKSISAEKEKILRSKISVLCTALLLCAYLFSAPFYTQLLLFLFLLFINASVLKSGFGSLVTLTPDAELLVTLSAFFALLHGVSDFSAKNCFFYASLSLTFACLCPQKREKEKGYAEKTVSIIIALALVTFVMSVIVNAVRKKDFFTALNNAYLSFVLSCPCIVAYVMEFFAALTKKECEKYRIILQKPSAFEKIGETKEIIIGQSGIVTQKEYSLYDLYSTDGDKQKLLYIAAAIEYHFSHPYGHALTEAATEIGDVHKNAENCYEICSKGVCGTVEGDKYLIGNKRLMKDKKVNIPDIVEKMDFGMYMPLYMAKNGEFCGMFLLYSKMTCGAGEALDILGEQGIRRILLADGERADLKKHFDILLCEKEKVLQEFEKGVKIKAMTVTEKRIANADVTVLVSDRDGADVHLRYPFLPSLLYVLLICKKSTFYYKAALFTATVAAVSLSVTAAFDVAFLPLTAALATVLPLAFCIGMTGQQLPQINAMEEEHMFGKINYTMKIEGMSCTHCSARVKTALESLRGVNADVSLEDKTARVKCPSSTKAETLEKAVSDVGFTVVSVDRV